MNVVVSPWVAAGFIYFMFILKDKLSFKLCVVFATSVYVTVFLHELTHAFAAYLVGYEVEKIVIHILGGWTQTVEGTNPHGSKLLVLAGLPLLAHVLVFLGDYSINGSLKDASNFRMAIALPNVILLVINAIPTTPLDGGKVLQALVQMIGAPEIMVYVISALVSLTAFFYFLWNKEWLAAGLFGLFVALNIHFVISI